MSLSPSLVIRIVPDEGEAVDWTVHQNIVFRDVLEAISQVMPNTTATAFEYDDEEGDRITVRGDEELQAMISGYLWMTSERLRKDLTQEPLIIYPKGGSLDAYGSIPEPVLGRIAVSPERILGDEYSIRSELWSLGVSLLEMALGRFPYPTPIALLQCIVHETHPFIASNDDGNVDMISMWVCRQLEERRSRVHSMDSPSSE
ncbi:Dual specificity mitogen-activated protein kinase kinase 5 [Acropora cervicornis]|uniref:Dual specificity mitogen-activated protein kinase kinase 5 n=1 Tax=Acropora cervicornis TaxID=6130 RepID=A0AAD9R4R4_ACRCE|nr:Dual specificity mitogen-activated protein kinase kinase 5 [Acropora cervicornis]